MVSVKESLLLITKITGFYNISKNQLSKVLEIDFEKEEDLTDSHLMLKEIMNPSKFIGLLEKKGHLLTPSAREKVYQNVKGKYEKLKMKESGLVFGKVLQSNELGIRPNGERAGSFALIAQQVAKDFFGELTISELNPKKKFTVKESNSGEVHNFNYDYHNSKIVESKPNGRNEYRMYSGYIKALDPDDIILMIESPNSGEDYIVGCIHPESPNYNEIMDLIKKYKVGRSLSALIPSLELISKGVTFTEMFEGTELPSLESSPLDDGEVIDERLGVELSTILSPEALAELLKKSLETDGIDRTVTILKKIKRDRRFRKAVLEAYNYKCAVTGQSIVYGDTLNVQAAHIKGKEYGGSDNPTNGLSLSLDLHWAFDHGFFSINDDFTIQVHEKMQENKILQEIDRKKLLLPQDKTLWPNLDMIKYHRDYIYGKFIN
ncbi:HNH endonuclease [Bacillus velezensis]|uniref:HNH endonuclease n=1 Tax=Bacillus velezensis TaxID=492670 RepID=UPI002E1E9674|nr:HNH endonuclease [Bacillus velezensis]